MLHLQINIAFLQSTISDFTLSISLLNIFFFTWAVQEVFWASSHLQASSNKLENGKIV